MRIKLFLAYDGTDFCGWQRQKNGVSVQETVENAIFSLTGEKVTITGSGRTDAGVHAVGQVAHFDTKSSIPPERFYKALNPFLVGNVKATKSQKANDDFNACKDAKNKTYSYDFYYSEVENPVFNRFALRIDGAPDFDLIKSAIDLRVGEHDFKAFCATGSSIKTTVRTIYSIKVIKTENGFRLLFTGNGFLYNMVRIMAGAILDVGNRILSLKELESAITLGERSSLGKTLSPQGLTLQSVEY